MMVAQFAIIFFRVSQPLHETFLVDELDGSRTDARMVQRPVGRCLRPAHSTDFYGKNDDNSFIQINSN